MTDSVTWRKTRRSNPGGNCVEAGQQPGDPEVLVRDSKHPAGPGLTFPPQRWRAFTAAMKEQP